MLSDYDDFLDFFRTERLNCKKQLSYWQKRKVDLEGAYERMLEAKKAAQNRMHSTWKKSNPKRKNSA